MEKVKCHFCDKSFNTDEALRMHQSAKHPELKHGVKKDIPFQRKSKKTRNIFILVVVTGIIGLFFWWATTTVTSVSNTTLEIQEGDHVKGNPNAPVKIYEFSDFQCPFCRRFFFQTFPQIEEQYIDTGKVAFVYKHFISPIAHPQAQKAAEAAECVAEQDAEKFWEIHDMMFQQQELLSTDSYKRWAGELGLNQGQFNECLDSGKYASKVTQDQAFGSNLGVRGTPGFIVNGRLVAGAQPFNVFQQMIESSL